MSTRHVSFTLVVERGGEEIEVDCTATISSSPECGPSYGDGGLPAEYEIEIDEATVNGKPFDLEDGEMEKAYEKAEECDRGY